MDPHRVNLNDALIARDSQNRQSHLFQSFNNVPGCLHTVQYLYCENEIDGGRVETVTISPKYQVILPKEICDQLSLLPGQQLHVIDRGNRIELIPVHSRRQMRGFLKGIDTRVERKGDRV